jgi:hypothetical protein
MMSNGVKWRHFIPLAVIFVGTMCLMKMTGDEMTECKQEQERKKREKELWESEKPLRDAQLQEMIKYSPR